MMDLTYAAGGGEGVVELAELEPDDAGVVEDGQEDLELLRLLAVRHVVVHRELRKEGSRERRGEREGRGGRAGTQTPE